MRRPPGNVTRRASISLLLGQTDSIQPSPIVEGKQERHEREGDLPWTRRKAAARRVSFMPTVISAARNLKYYTSRPRRRVPATARSVVQSVGRKERSRWHQRRSKRSGVLREQ